MYNVKKFQILLAIKACNDAKIPAIPFLISQITGFKYVDTRVGVSQYYQCNYIEREPYEELKRFKCFKYKISKNGESALEKYSARYNAGMDLNLRRKPRPFDWSKIDMLPGLYIIEEIKNKKKGK